jgi:hypothetical protein
LFPKLPQRSLGNNAHAHTLTVSQFGNKRAPLHDYCEARLAHCPSITYSDFLLRATFFRRGEACLRPRWVGDHKDRPYTGRIHLQTTISAD